MGNWMPKLRNPFEACGTTRAKMLMVGLDAAGKTTVLQKLKLSETIATASESLSTAPETYAANYETLNTAHETSTSTTTTSGVNVETVSLADGIELTVYDLGGHDQSRHLWKHYCKNVDGLIFVVDSADGQRMAEAREELFGILDSDEMRGVPVVVLANKQDLPSSFDASQMSGQLQLMSLSGRSWFVHETCAITGQGIRDVMQRLAIMVKQRNNE